MRKNIYVNVIVNVLVNKTRIGKQDAKTIVFVSAVPESQSSSSSFTSEAHAQPSTSTAVCLEGGTTDVSTVNVTVTLNVTAGK